MATTIKKYGTGQELAVASGSGTNADPIVPQVQAGGTDLITVTCTLDTNAYASGDLLVDTAEIAAATTAAGKRSILQSLTIIDKDAQGVAFSIYFMSTSTSFGTINSAPNISDANLVAGLQGRVDVATTDYTTVSGAKVACLRNLGIVLESVASSSIYFAIINGAGTPTFTASGLVLVLGFLQD